MNLWDGARGVKLTDEVIFALWRHAQRRPTALTAGGVLMGKENILGWTSITKLFLISCMSGTSRLSAMWANGIRSTRRCQCTQKGI